MGQMQQLSSKTDNPQQMAFIRRRTVLLHFLTAIAVLSFILAWVGYSYLKDNSPTSPDYATGNIYEMRMHGYVFYVTNTTRLIHGALMFSPGPLLILIYYLSRRWGIPMNEEDRRSLERNKR